MNCPNHLIIEKLKDVVQDAFQSPNRDYLTVKSVRNQVEKDLCLKDGFLRSGDWKRISKKTIEAHVQELLVVEDQDNDSSLQVSGSAAQTQELTEQRSKRARRDSNNEVVRKRRKNSLARSKRNEEESNQIQNNSKASTELQATGKKAKSKSIKIKEDDSIKDLSSSGNLTTDKETIPEHEIANNDDARMNLKSDVVVAEDEQNIDSDTSVVIDEPTPISKRKKKHNISKSKLQQNVKTKRSSSSKEKLLSPDEATLKTLQNQLRKCGIRTIWHFELKNYGDDTQAKILHLKNYLKDIGMKGRFSEAKAKEIKESRELIADLEAVKEGDKAWGLKSGERRSTLQEERKNICSMNEEVRSDVSNEMNLRNKASRDKSTLSEKPRPPNSLDWLGVEEDSE